MSLFVQRAKEVLSRTEEEVTARYKSNSVEWEKIGKMHTGIAGHLRQKMLQELALRGLPKSKLKEHTLYNDYLLHKRLATRYNKAAQFNRLTSRHPRPLTPTRSR